MAKLHYDKKSTYSPAWGKYRITLNNEVYDDRGKFVTAFYDEPGFYRRYKGMAGKRFDKLMEKYLKK